MNKKSHKSIHKSQKDILFSLIDPIYFSIAFVFAKQGRLDSAFTEVDLSSDWGIMSPSEDEIICDKYGVCVIPFYDCVFLTMGLYLPFTAFEIEVLKHLAMDPSQLYHSC